MLLRSFSTRILKRKRITSIPLKFVPTMEKDLLVIAKEYELQGFQKNEGIFSRLSALEEPLNDVYVIRRPSATDYNDRRDLIRFFNEIAREIHGSHDGCPVVKDFGSYLMDMFDAKSDLDLSINLSDKKSKSQRDVQINTLRKFAKKLRVLQQLGHVRNVTSIFSARVPVLKVTDFCTGIECDLSVGNLDGIAKSHIIRIISAIDERFQKLCFLMKVWAKAHDINSSKDGTLNSLSLILLVAFLLQTRQSPIFPPFSAILKDEIDPVAVGKVIPSFMNYGKENKESLAELFVSLLIMLESVETLWEKGLCASVFEGSWKFKTWKTKKGEKYGCISIEDFTDSSQNTARAVRPSKMSKIYTCIHHSLQHIRSFINGEIDAFKLKDRLFGPVRVVGNKVIIDTPIFGDSTTQIQRKKNRRGNLSKTKRKRARLAKENSTHMDTGKLDRSPFPPMASSQRERLRVDMSQETIRESQIHQLPHYAHHHEHYLPRTHHEHYLPRTNLREHYLPRTHQHERYLPRTHHGHHVPRTHHDHYLTPVHHQPYHSHTQYQPYHPLPHLPPNPHHPLHPTHLPYSNHSSYPQQQYHAAFEYRRDADLQSYVYRRNP